jgi:hypothetical protein
VTVIGGLGGETSTQYRCCGKKLSHSFIPSIADCKECEGHHDSKAAPYLVLAIMQ